MNKLLRDICCVEEVHPLLNKFEENTSLQDLHDQFCEIYTTELTSTCSRRKGKYLNIQ